MNNRYNRNRIYISEKLQQKIKKIPILIGGAGIGSVIAECALRLGFETLTIIDGDIVEESNLNRQNYSYNDINNSKVYALRNRLIGINPKASITIYNQYLNLNNINEIIFGHSIAINTLDFTTDLPLIFDEMCQKNNIHIIHPYNLGFAGAVTIVSPEGHNLRSLIQTSQKASEIDFVCHLLSNLVDKNSEWLKDILDRYLNEKEKISPPQLSIGAWILSGVTVSLMLKIIQNENVKYFPQFYFNNSF